MKSDISTPEIEFTIKFSLNSLIFFNKLILLDMIFSEDFLTLKVICLMLTFLLFLFSRRDWMFWRVTFLVVASVDLSIVFHYLLFPNKYFDIGFKVLYMLHEFHAFQCFVEAILILTFIIKNVGAASRITTKMNASNMYTRFYNCLRILHNL